LSCNRFLRAIDRAGLAGDIWRWPQSAADRELASLRAANQSHHLACVLAYALASEPVFEAGGFIERERARCGRLVADAANEFDRLLWCGGGRGRGLSANHASQ